MRIDVLIDGENVPSAHWPAVRRSTALLGRLGAVTVFSCSRTGWDRVEEVERICVDDMPGRNAADFLLAMRAGELGARKKPRRAVAVVSGDDGFGVVVRTLKSEGKMVFVIAPTTERVPRRLAVSADLMIILPPVDPIEARAALLPIPTTWTSEGVAAVLSVCPADAGGWVSFRSARRGLVAAGLMPSDGKRLARRLRLLGDYEVEGEGNRGRVRRIAGAG